MKEEDIERALLEDVDLSDVGEESEAVTEVDRVFEDLHDALIWEEEEQHEVQPCPSLGISAPPTKEVPPKGHHRHYLHCV